MGNREKRELINKGKEGEEIRDRCVGKRRRDRE